MRVAFCGKFSSVIAEGIDKLLPPDVVIRVIMDMDAASPDERGFLFGADVIVGQFFGAWTPHAPSLRLFQVCGAGVDGVDVHALPRQTALCNCHGHEKAIAEYVFAAVLGRIVPFGTADRELRAGVWRHWSGADSPPRKGLAAHVLGLLGYGRIGRCIAEKAKAFGMLVNVANRGSVAGMPGVDRYFPLDDLAEFWKTSDIVVASLPLTEDTRGIVGQAAFTAMPDDALFINVGRGATVDEAALFRALAEDRIGHAVIDTWYRYPASPDEVLAPSSYAFQTLSNITMTPHMSGWDTGTIAARRAAIARNIVHALNGEPYENVVREPANPDVRES